MSEPWRHRLRNNAGMEVTLLALGARVASISLPVRGQRREMTLTYPSDDHYRQDPFYLGATVGRVCNRIANARFQLNDRYYQLSQNSGEHCLHGGAVGFSARSWHFVGSSLSDNQAELRLHSPDGEQGFPGALSVSVLYRLSDDNRLQICYQAQSDRDTLVNLCNHCYFHLGESGCDELHLQLLASRYLPADASGIPNGSIAQVNDGPFCFGTPASLGERLGTMRHPDLLMHQGFDHCYLLDQHSMSQPVALLRGRSLGVELRLFTDQPGLQFYSGQYLAGEFAPYRALCLEAQNLPDAINQPGFPSPILRANERYNRQLCYQFVVSA